MTPSNSQTQMLSPSWAPAGKLLTFSVIWLSLDYLVFGKCTFIAMGDNGDIILPGLLANKAGGYGSPLWHVFSTAGNDRLSQGFFGFIFTGMFDYLPGWFSYQLLMVSQIFCAVMGTYWLCCKNLNFSGPASFVAGILYANVTTNGLLIQSVLSYLPISILVLSLLFEKRTRWSSWIIVILVLLIISGTAYLSRLQPFLFFIDFLWFVFVQPQTNYFSWLIIALFSAGTIALRWQDYFAAASYGADGYRQPQFSENPLTVVWNSLSPSIGDIVSIVTAIFLLIGLILYWRNSPHIRRIVTALIIGYITVVAALFLKPFLEPYIPFLSGFNLQRSVAYLWLFQTIGAGGFILALERLKNNTIDNDSSMKLRLLKGSPSVAILLVLLTTFQSKYYSVKDWISQGSYVHAYESPSLKKFTDRIKKNPEPHRTASFQMYPNVLHSYGIETVGGYQGIHLKRFEQFWKKIVQPSVSDFRSVRFMLSPRDHKSEWHFDQEYNFNLLSLANMKYIVSRDPLISEWLLLIRRAEKPWSSLATFEKIKVNFLDNFTGRRDLYIYENLRAFPRIFFVQSIQPFEDDNRLLEAMAMSDMAALRKNLFANIKDLPTNLDTNQNYFEGQADFIKYSPDEIRLFVRLEASAVLIVTNSFSKYWTVEIDGKLGDIFPAYHAFWGVALPPSASQVVFKYNPPWK